MCLSGRIARQPNGGSCIYEDFISSEQTLDAQEDLGSILASSPARHSGSCTGMCGRKHT